MFLARKIPPKRIPSSQTKPGSTNEKTITIKEHTRTIKRRKKTPLVPGMSEITIQNVKTQENIPSIDKHIDKPITKRHKKQHTHAVIETPMVQDALPNIPTQTEEPSFPIYSISKLVLASMICILKGNLSAEFKLGNLSFTADEILHHSSGIIDGVDKKLYSKYSTINKPQGVYSNEAYNFLARNLKSIIGMQYKQGLNELNSRLGTHFVSSSSPTDIGANDLSATMSDLNKLGEYVKVNYDWFANGSLKRPGRGVDIISSSGLSKSGSIDSTTNNIKITITKKKISIENSENMNWAETKNIVQQKLLKTKTALDIDNKLVTAPISQPLNLPIEYVNLSGLEEIDGAYWKLVKTVGKTKYYQSPITNSRKPFLVI